MNELTEDYNFKWVGSKVQCYVAGLKGQENHFYRSFAINETVFTVGDAATYNNTNRKKKQKICKLLCVYESRDISCKEKPYRGIVRWFLAKKNSIPNEVVEDHENLNVFISLDYIRDKCNVKYFPIDKNLTNFYESDRDSYVCRYKFKCGEYVPILPAKTSRSTNEIICISDSEDEIVNSITSPMKRVKLTTPSDDDKGAATRGVKRNLNESFQNVVSSQENTPTLNYSVVEQDDAALKMKLRLSEQQDMKVILTKLDNQVLDMYLKKWTECETPSRKGRNAPRGEEDCSSTPYRRSNRQIERKSYADFSSPKKLKRQLSSDSDCFLFTKTPSRKSATTTKRLRIDSDDDAESLTNSQENLLVVPSSSKTPNSRDVKTFTPKSRNTPTLKLIREGALTPAIQHRLSSIKKSSTPLMRARAHLHVSYVPDSLSCREKEYRDVYNFLEGKLNDGCGGCMYISGVPGTGKTATVTNVVKNLQESHAADFTFISVNGMRLTEPKQTYVEILKQLNGKTVPWEQAQSTLHNIFTKSSKKSAPIILLIDELDILCTKRQDVVYNLLDWPSKAVTQLIVLTIANTMDLPERLLMSRVTSRLGLTRLTFQPYTHKQLQEIVTMRLIGTNAFNPDAVQLVARKVASVSGDARRALDICRRAAEIAEAQGPKTLVSMTHVNEALNAMITQPKVQAVMHCSRLQQLLLQSVVAEVERTGVEETTFMDVYTMFTSLCTLEGLQIVTITVALRAVSQLAACRLLLTDNKQNDTDQRIILNISTDDVYYALKKN